MPDLDDMIEQLRRMRARPEAGDRDWYRIRAAADTRRAEVSIYDDIGWMGTSAKSFAAELNAIDADVIDLHLNSPGGDAWDGIAIYNALRDYPARVNVVVDGLAASAASVIAMAGDTIKMNRGAQLMIHDAWGLVIGNAADMVDAASMFDKISDGLASIYAARAGGDVASWRTAMSAETWYTAAEAVDAGLADDLVEDEPAPEVKSRWDLAAYAFAYAGRPAAPAPVFAMRPAPPPVTAAEAARRIHAAVTKTPTAQVEPTKEQEGAGMDPAKIREALGLAPDVSDEQVMAALTSARQPVDQATPDPAPTTKPPAAPASGTMTIDVSAWAEQQDRIKRLEAADARRRRDERDQVIAQAVTDGKFAPTRKDHWVRLWDADPEGTRQVIDGLAKNVIPVAALGYDGDIDKDIEKEFADLFPPASTGKGN